MGIRRVATMVVLVAASAAAAYFVFFKPRPVRAHAVDRGEAVVEVLGTGSIESRRTIDLGFEVTARVVRLDVDQGDLVKQDQELAAVDPTTFRAAVAVATENLKLAEAAIERLASDVARGKAVLEGAEANIRRVRPLVEERVTSPDSLDIADERLKVAVADLARASAAKIEGDRRVRTVQRTLEQAEADLARTVARSPFDGLVLKREREVGDVAVPGAPVLRLAAMDVIWASVWVDETFLDPLREGQQARVFLRSAPQRPLVGRVARIGREVDRETRELLVDVSLDPVPDRFAIGQRVDLWIEIAKKGDVLRLPPAFVAYANGRAGAFVLEDGSAHFRPIEIGGRGRDWVEVVGGLDVGSLAVRPLDAIAAPLRDGDRIRPIEKSTP